MGKFQLNKQRPLFPKNVIVNMELFGVNDIFLKLLVKILS